MGYATSFPLHIQPFSHSNFTLMNIFLFRKQKSWRKKRVNAIQQCPQEDKLVRHLVYLFSWITFISVIMFFFLLIWVSMCCQCIQEWTLIWRKKMKLSMSVVVSESSVEVTALQRIISWIGSVAAIFTCVFQRKTSIKMAIFSLVPFPFTISFGIFLDLPGRAECVGFHFKQGPRVHHINRGLS